MGNFIGSYDNIRKTIRLISLYGCYCRDDFDNVVGVDSKNYSTSLGSRKYDNVFRKARYVVDEKFINENFENNNKYVGLKRDIIENSQNYLFNFYKLKSSKNMMTYFLGIQQILNSSDEFLEIENILNSFSKNFLEDENGSTLRRRLDDLEDDGIILKIEENNKYKYKISPDFFEDFSVEEIIDIFYAVQFYSNIGLTSVSGYYINSLIKRYLKYNRNFCFEENELFIFRHLAFNKILEDDIICQIISCIKNHKSKKFLYEKKYGKEYEIEIIPLNIITEYSYGRQYVFAINCFNNKVKLYRLDKIYNISDKKIKNKVEIHNQNKIDTNEICCNKYLENSWCTSMKHDLIDVEIDFLFNEDKESYILERLKREGKWGDIIKIEQNHYLYKIKVSDPVELKPWIRSFAGFAKVRKSEKHNLYEVIQEEWRESLEKYGAI